MEDPNILDLDYPVFSQVQKILENPSTLQSFLEILPPDCSSDDVLISMELSCRQYNNTPAKELLRFLGNKGARVSHLIKWFQEMGLERALVFLKTDEILRIVEHPQQEVRVIEGEELLLTCIAVSYPPPEYQWYKDDIELLMEVDSKLSIKPARIEDSGIYTCLVTKFNVNKNAYEWLYSEYSKVEVIESDLHAISPYEGPLTSSFVIAPERTSFKTFNQDKEVLLLDGKTSVNPIKFAPVSQTSESSNKELVVIQKQPFVDGKIAQGMSVCLTCEAVSSLLPVNYQWFKNGRPLPGKTDSQLLLNHLYPDPETGEKKWLYQCEVYNDLDRAFSEIATVELDESNNRTPYVATQKYAFMVANDTYDHLECLEKPAADVRDLADLLSSMGFKIFAFRNLTLTEMRNTFASYCKALTPGSYALFFFAGHGFELYGQTYLQPVDSSDSLFQHESMCSEYILQCMQERKPAMNVLLIDACRKLPPKSRSECYIQPGKIFPANMKNNTIYGYSTTFLCASHESDDETNSVFVKHLKKHITHNKCVEDILISVKNDFSKDPVARNVQFPAIKSTLSEQRKLNDPSQEECRPTPFSDIMNWCDVKREVIRKSFEIPQIKAAIIMEFHHHMKTFCNGIDVHVYLNLEPTAQIFILKDMEINITFISPVINIKPVDGAALKDIDLLVGTQNFLFKKEISNIQKLDAKQMKGSIFLKFFSKNNTHKKDFCFDLIEIAELQLSVNHLTSINIEEPSPSKNQIHVNSFT